jgi:hypothetical protein
MFTSYKIIKYLGSKDGAWQYKITDSEFGTVSGIVEIFPTLVDMVIVVIQEYSKRNLNVAANLIRAFVWYNKLHPYWSIQQLIDHNKMHNPLFQQYEEDLQKYLALL